jgi:hypothetical protein
VVVVALIAAHDEAAGFQVIDSAEAERVTISKNVVKLQESYKIESLGLFTDLIPVPFGQDSSASGTTPRRSESNSTEHP